MTIGRTLFRTLENPLQPLTSQAIIDWLGGKPVHAGVTVNEESALAFSAVYRCVALIAGGNAALPLKTYDRISDAERQRVHIPLVEKPCPLWTPFEFWELMFSSALLRGNAYAWKQRDQLGRITALWPLLAQAVEPRREDPTSDNPSGKFFTLTHRKGQDADLTPYEIFHIPGMGFDGVKGMSVIGVARQAIGMGLAMEEYGARFFGNGALMSGFLKTEAKIKDEQVATAIKRRFQQAFGGVSRSHEVAVLDSGLDFQALTIPNEDAQFLESRRFQLGDIARFFGVPPHKIGDVERSTSWGAGIEAQTVGFYVDTQRPWLTRFEQRVTYDLLEKRPRTYAEFDIAGTLRADVRAQTEAYWRAVGRPWKSPDEIRALDNDPPIPGGAALFAPTNMAPATSMPAELQGGSQNGSPVPTASEG